MGTEIFQFGPGKAEKIGFKDVNLNFKVFMIMDSPQLLEKTQKMKVFWPFKHEPNFLCDIIYIKQAWTWLCFPEP